MRSRALARRASDDDELEIRIAARGIVDAARYLVTTFSLIATNVPYLARGKQSDRLRSYSATNYDAAKTDLATTFMLRALDFAPGRGTIAVVAPQSWRFQAAYTGLRSQLLRCRTINMVGVLGSGAFETISGEVVNVGLFVLSGPTPSADHLLSFVDASGRTGSPDKSLFLANGEVGRIPQAAHLSVAGEALTLVAPSRLPLLEEFASSNQGLKTGDDGEFRRNFWEIPRLGATWKRYQSTVSEPVFYGGLHNVLWWKSEGTTLARKQGLAAWGHTGIAISQMSGLPAAVYLGGAFDSNMSALVPNSPDNMLPILAFCSSEEYRSAVRTIDQSLKPTNSSLVRLIGSGSTAIKRRYLAVA